MEGAAEPQRKMSTAGESLYKALGLEKGASPEEIKKAYRYTPEARNVGFMVLYDDYFTDLSES